MNGELLSICFRYADGHKDIRKVFLQFLELERITRSHIGAALLSFYKSSGIDIKPVVDNVFEKYKGLQICFDSSQKLEKLLKYVCHKIMR